MALLLADDEFDPIAAASLEPVIAWAGAFWDKRVSLRYVAPAHRLVTARLANAVSPWGQVRGPLSATAVTLTRLQLEWLAPTSSWLPTGAAWT